MSNKPRYRPPTIDGTGLEAWINRRTDVGFTVFRVWHADYKARIITRAAFARKMGVDKRTIKDWIDRHERSNNGQ